MSEWTLILPRPRAISRFLVVTLKKKKKNGAHQGHRSISYLARYMDRQECGFSSLSLYTQPEAGSERTFCRSRESLLSAMSNGGRHGFDAAYASQGKFSFISPHKPGLDG